jgi:peptidoglycan/LPS O-acetylase OafA/YrhL
MGLLRFLLAVSVLALHSNTIFGLTFVGGEVAVQAFYMISGFYMALVLDGKYNATNWSGYKLFITNRLLKLYPIYWLTLLSVISLGVLSYIIIKSTYIFDYYVINNKLLTPINWIYITFSNIFILGQDVLFFIGYNESGYFFQSAYKEAPTSLHRFLFIKQAWTISLEIYFYLMVPFLNKLKSSILILGIVLGFLIRFYIYYLGHNNIPWTYQFYIFELGFFLTGLIMYRWYKQKKQWISMLGFQKIILPLSVLATIAFQFIGEDSIVKNYIYLLLFAWALPFIFERTKNNRIDRLIGETSYPIYMIHGLIGLLVTLIIPTSNMLFGTIILILSLVLTLVFNQTILKYIENFRQKRVSIKHENSN